MTTDRQPTLADRLRERSSQVATQDTRSAAQVVREFEEALAFTDDFFKAVEDGDTLVTVLHQASMGGSRIQAARACRAKSWGDWRGTIAVLARREGEQGGPATECLTTIALFEENAILAEALDGALSQIVRPARLIFSTDQFSGFLFDLVQKGLAVAHAERPGGVQSFEWRGQYYVAKRSATQARMCWGLVVRALNRARNQDEAFAKIEPLLIPLTDQVNLLNDLDQQNLHQIAHRGIRTGSMAFWEANSKIYDPSRPRGQNLVDAGLFGVAIERLEGAQDLVLLGAVTDPDHPLPEVMTSGAYELPLIFTTNEFQPNAALEVALRAKSVDALPREEREALRRIEHLIRRRLTDEGDFRVPALVAAESEAPVDEVDALGTAMTAVEALELPDEEGDGPVADAEAPTDELEAHAEAGAEETPEAEAESSAVAEEMPEPAADAATDTDETEATATGPETETTNAAETETPADPVVEPPSVEGPTKGDEATITGAGKPPRQRRSTRNSTESPSGATRSGTTRSRTKKPA